MTRLAYLKIRHERHDLLYSWDSVDLLLQEIATLSERCVVPQGYTLWGDYIEQAHVSHHCGETKSVDNLFDAVEWQRGHTCETTS